MTKGVDEATKKQQFFEMPTATLGGGMGFYNNRMVFNGLKENTMQRKLMVYDPTSERGR